MKLMDAQEKLTETRNNYYSALYNYNTALAALEKAMGIDAQIYQLEETAGSNAIDALDIASIEEDNIDEQTGRLVHRAGRNVADVVLFGSESETGRPFDKRE